MITLFGTDGIRARVGTSPLTIHGLHNLGKAIGLWALQSYGPNVRMLIGHDTRHSCAWAKTNLKSGLLTFPISLTDAQVLPTPAVCALLDNFHCGIIISASHNPYYDNGIKIIDARTGKLSAEDEKEITTIFYGLQEQALYEITSEQEFGTITHGCKLANQYIEKVISRFKPGFLSNKKIILDCANGATSSLARPIFEYTGTQIITINDHPNGKNINDACGAVHLESLQKAVLQEQAAIGFAFDGDGDRVIAVSREGEIKNGDDILALLSQHHLYRDLTTIVGTSMTNQGFEDFLNNQNKKLVRTEIGDKHITEYLEQHDLLLGGEQSGHIIMRDYLHTGDGIFAALRVLEVIQETDNWNLTTFKRYPQFIRNVAVTAKKDLSSSPFAEIIEQGKTHLSSGRVLIRYSGTEPLLRIMVEAPDHGQASQVVETLAHQLGKVLS